MTFDWFKFWLMDQLKFRNTPNESSTISQRICQCQRIFHKYSKRDIRFHGSTNNIDWITIYRNLGISTWMTHQNQWPCRYKCKTGLFLWQIPPQPEWDLHMCLDPHTSLSQRMELEDTEHIINMLLGKQEMIAMYEDLV